MLESIPFHYILTIKKIKSNILPIWLGSWIVNDQVNVKKYKNLKQQQQKNTIWSMLAFVQFDIEYIANYMFTSFLMNKMKAHIIKVTVKWYM